MLVTLKDSDQALTTQFIGGVFKDYSGVFDDAADSLFNVEIIKGTANDDGVLIHSIKKDLLVDGGAGSDPPPIKESRLDRYFAIHNRNFIGGILDGEEASYGGADYREAASG